jgi:hypothetical protein
MAGRCDAARNFAGPDGGFMPGRVRQSRQDLTVDENTFANLSNQLVALRRRMVLVAVVGGGLGALVFFAILLWVIVANPGRDLVFLQTFCLACGILSISIFFTYVAHLAQLDTCRTRYGRCGGATRYDQRFNKLVSCIGVFPLPLGLHRILGLLLPARDVGEVDGPEEVA